MHVLKKVPSRSVTPILVLVVWLTAFLLAAGLIGVTMFVAVRNFISSYDVTALDGIAIKNPTAAPGAVEVGPVATQGIMQPSDGPAPQPWNGASRVTALVMGLDLRDWEAGEGPPRTDTMILFTVDPLTHTAGMLNIPRDLWVNIPGFGYGKINTAYPLGEGSRLPGGGPGLAMKTVEEFLGVPIQFYAQIDFFAFERFIDQIDGIEIDVPAEITIDPIGPDNTVTLQPGVQRLYGPEALAYARARYTEGGDFDRAQRQQQVIFGIRNRALKARVLPSLIARSPTLYQELASGVHTNLTLEQAIQLAWLAEQIQPENIRRGVISPPEQVTLLKSPDGLDILKPITDKIRRLRDEIFAENGLASPVSANAQPVELMQAEGAHIAVLNGTFAEGLASRTSDYFTSIGANVITTGDAGQLYNSTTLIDYTGNPYTLKYFMELMGVQPGNIQSQYNPDSELDVAVILGTDWAGSNPMP